MFEKKLSKIEKKFLTRESGERIKLFRAEEESFRECKTERQSRSLIGSARADYLTSEERNWEEKNDE